VPSESGFLSKPARLEVGAGEFRGGSCLMRATVQVACSCSFLFSRRRIEIVQYVSTGSLVDGERRARDKISLRMRKIV
jgi:hypothetical protein